MRHLIRIAAGLAMMIILPGCMDDWGSFDLFGPSYPSGPDCEPTSVTISGSVIDAVTSEPIPGAEISESGRDGTVTDEQGNFSVTSTVDGCWMPLWLEARADGYLPFAGIASSGIEIHLYRHRPLTVRVDHGSGAELTADVIVEQPYQHWRFRSAQLETGSYATLDSVPRPAVLRMVFRGDERFPYLATSFHLSPTGPDTVRLKPESAWIDHSVDGDGALYAELPAWQLDGSVPGVLTEPVLFHLPSPGVLHVAPGVYIVEGYGEQSCGCRRRVEVAAGDTARVQM